MEESKIITESKSYCYLAKGKNGYKIGKSVDPERRMKQLKTADPTIRLIAYGDGMSERALHRLYKKRNINGEWYSLIESEVNDIKNKLNNQYELPRISKREDNRFGYIIKSGKYAGMKICHMTSKPELNYMRWYVKEFGKFKTHQVKMFKWWVKQF